VPGFGARWWVGCWLVMRRARIVWCGGRVSFPSCVGPRGRSCRRGGVGHEVLPAGVDEAVVFPAQQDQVVDVCAAVIGGPLGPVVGLTPGGCAGAAGVSAGPVPGDEGVPLCAADGAGGPAEIQRLDRGCRGWRQQAAEAGGEALPIVVERGGHRVDETQQAVGAGAPGVPKLLARQSAAVGGDRGGGTRRSGEGLGAGKDDDVGVGAVRGPAFGAASSQPASLHQGGGEPF